MTSTSCDATNDVKRQGDAWLVRLYRKSILPTVLSKTLRTYAAESAAILAAASRMLAFPGVIAPLPHARLALLDCNHEIPIEQPRELAALLQAFVAGLG